MRLIYTQEAVDSLMMLAADKSQKVQLKAVQKALRLLAGNPRHTGLNTHKFQSKTGPEKEPLFEAYAQNKTPGAYRIFFFYPAASKETIVIASIIRHP